MNTNAADDVLFYIESEAGWRTYYHGTEPPGGMELTHVTVEDSDGNFHVVVFAAYTPVQWITSQGVIAVNKPRNTQLDPTDAYHLVIPLVGDQEDGNVDIYPNDLDALLTRVAALGVDGADDVRALLADLQITQFSELVDLAGQAGEDQPHFIALAVGIGASAAALQLGTTFASIGELSTRSRSAAGVSKQGPSSLLRDLLTDILVELFKYGLSQVSDSVFGDLFPQGPNMLLCRGASTLPGVCHYIFFPLACNAIGTCADEFGCVSFCATSMSCFSSICTTRDGGMTSELASGLIDTLMQ